MLLPAIVGHVDFNSTIVTSESVEDQRLSFFLPTALDVFNARRSTFNDAMIATV